MSVTEIEEGSITEEDDVSESDLPKVYYPLKYYCELNSLSPGDKLDMDNEVLCKIMDFCGKVTERETNSSGIFVRGEKCLNDKNILIGINNAGDLFIEDL